MALRPRRALRGDEPRRDAAAGRVRQRVVRLSDLLPGLSLDEPRQSADGGAGRRRDRSHCCNSVRDLHQGFRHRIARARRAGERWRSPGEFCLQWACLDSLSSPSLWGCRSGSMRWDPPPRNSWRAPPSPRCMSGPCWSLRRARRSVCPRRLPLSRRAACHRDAPAGAVAADAAVGEPSFLRPPRARLVWRARTGPGARGHDGADLFERIAHFLQLHLSPDPA